MKRPLVLVALLACGRRAEPVSSVPVSSVDVSHGLELVNAQFRAVKARDEVGVASTLSPTGVKLWPYPSTFARGTPGGFISALLRLDPHDEWKASRLEDSSIVGNEDVIIAQFGVVTDKLVNEGTNADLTVEIGVTEVFARDARWRSVALIGGELRDLRSSESLDAFAGATEAGPISALFDPSVAIASLRADAVVVGLTQLGRGDHTREVLEHTPKMTLIGEPREIRAASWGIAQAYLNAHTPNGNRRVVGQLVALREHGTWQVVSAHYVAL